MHSIDTIGDFKVNQDPTIKTGTQLDLLALQMVDLYSDCVRQVINDDEVRYHLVAMPEMAGSHYVFSVCAGEEDLADDVERLLGVEIGPDDCIVLLGREMLGKERNEDEMMKIVLADMALHLDRLWPVADETSGWIGSYIGYAAIASIIGSAHDVLKMLAPHGAVVEEIKTTSEEALMADKRFRDPKMEIPQNRLAFEAIDLVCDKALETQGCYITLPNTSRNLRNAAKSLFIETVDGMSQPLRTVI
ncbi:hypothetical protein G6L37_03435 [Agrobacterium rubi]|nr:hypothetical protein [Agrobacterium rubi]NTF24424.1 hypothetical protein [Agrobacterium rubi]